MEEPKTMDVFVFVGGAGQEAFDNAESLTGDTGVRFSTKVVGGWDLFLVLEVNDGDLHRVEDIVLEEIRGQHSTFTDTALEEAPGPGTERIKRSKGYPYEAFVRVKVMAGRNRKRVLDSIAEKLAGNYYASAVVQGTYDLLVEIGGQTLGEVKSAVGALRDLDGVGPGTQATFAQFDV